jgi:cholesterol transport system auxiliary component
MVRSLAGTGRFGFVAGQSSGPLPDYVLLTDLQAFQAEVAPAGANPPVEVVVNLTVTVLRDIDRRVVATRSFVRRAGAPDDDALTVVRAFDAAMQPVLAEMVSWTLAVVGGAGA